MSGLSARVFLQCWPGFRYSRRSVRFRPRGRLRRRAFPPLKRSRRPPPRLLPPNRHRRSGPARTFSPASSAAGRRPAALPRSRRLRSVSAPISSPAFSAAGRIGEHKGSPLFLLRPASPSASATPAGGQLQAAPAPEAAPPIGPGPGFAAGPDLTSPSFLTPPYGFGNPALSPLLPPNPAPGAAPTEPPSTTTLAPVRPGALPVQAYDLRAPAILIQPSVSVFGGYTDNPRGTPNNFSDAFGQFGGAAAVSVDTVRLQGQLNGSLDYLKYARATDQDRADRQSACLRTGNGGDRITSLSMAAQRLRILREPAGSPSPGRR